MYQYDAQTGKRITTKVKKFEDDEEEEEEGEEVKFE